MPPVDTLYSETKTKLDRLERRLTDAQTFQIPRLRNHVGTVALQQQYAAELREDLESCRRELQILETFVDDIVSAEHRKEAYDQLDVLIPKVEDLKKEFRAALLESKRNIDAQTPSHREELLRSSSLQGESSSRGQRTTASDDAVMNASEAVTEALRQTTQLMHQELERSILSTQLLEESTQTMSKTSDMYTTFGTLLTTSKNLVTALEKSDWLDRLLILSSLGLFLLVVAYIIKKRVIDKGLWLAFWWVKYLPLPQPRVSVSSTTSPAAAVVGTKDFIASISSLAASSVIAAIPLSASSVRSGVASEIASLASVAASALSDAAEPSLVTSLASSIVDDVLSRATQTAPPDDKSLPHLQDELEVDAGVETGKNELNIDDDYVLEEATTHESVVDVPIHQEL